MTTCVVVVRHVTEHSTKLLRSWQEMVSLHLHLKFLAREIKPEAIALRCVAILAEASGATGMVGGQMADLQAGGCSKNKSHES